MSLYDCYAVKFGDTLLGGMTQNAIDAETQARGEGSSGAVHPSFVSIVSQQINARITTLALKSALGVVGQLGASIETLGGVDLYGYKQADHGTRETGSAHRKYSVARGIVMPENMGCDHGEDVTLDYRLIATWDGENYPLIITDDQAVPLDPVDLDQERYTLGPVEIGGVTIPDLRNVQITFGARVEPEGANSDLWAKYAPIKALEPTITISTIDPTVIKDAGIPLIGKVGVHTDTTIYFRRRSQADMFYPNNQAKHVKITADGLVYPTQIVNAPNRGPATAGLEMRLRHDGTNNPMVIETETTIS